LHVSKIGKDIDHAAELLKSGQLIGIPTETVYGLAAHAFSEPALINVFKAKNRPYFDPLIVHVSSMERLHDIAEITDERLKALAQHFWPGPLTLLLPKKKNIPDLITSGLPRVGVRIPNHPMVLELLNKIDFPVAAPSANPFGYISPTEAAHVVSQLHDKVPYVLDGGPCNVGLESSIVGIENHALTLYRAGGISIEAIRQVAGSLSVKLNQSDNPLTPGQLKSHYAPKTRLIAGPLSELIPKFKSYRTAVLYTGQSAPDAFFVFNLSPHQQTDEMARNFFKGLRAADASGAEVILIDYAPPSGLGIAINDRIQRATATFDGGTRARS